MLKVALINVRHLEQEDSFRSGWEQMSEYRQKKIAGYYFREDRDLSLGGGLALDYLLRDYGLQEKEMIYKEGEYGKPLLANHPDIHFNLSHSRHYAACVLGDIEAGIDIEHVEPFDMELAEFCCDNQELTDLRSLPEKARSRAFTRLWTRKESLVKVTGTGLEDMPKTIRLDKEEYSFFDFQFGNYQGSLCTRESIDAPDIWII